MPDISPDLVIVDISLPGMNGVDLVKELRRNYDGVKLLVVTGHARERYFDAAMQAGADEFVTKGDLKLLLDKMRGLLT
jgi:DNA-binding NarL/FixJ family response regulator